MFVWLGTYFIVEFNDRIAGPAHFDPFGVKIERLHFVTFPNYTNRPF